MVQEVEYHLYWIDQLFDENCLSDFDKRFQEFSLLKPIATLMCYPFREDVEVDLLALKIAGVFPLHTSAVEEEILKVQADIDLKSMAPGQFGNLLTKEKHPNMRKCATALPFPTQRLFCQNTVPP